MLAVAVNKCFIRWCRESWQGWHRKFNNDFDTEFIAEEDVTQAASTQDTWVHQRLIFTEYQVTISQRRKKRTKKKNYGSGTKK